MKPKRGQKLCPSCNNINGARSHNCKHCNHEFVSNNKTKTKAMKVKKSKRYVEVDDWTSLQNGDTIKVIGRSGNYYVGSNGDRQYMTDAGIYKVMHQQGVGLVVYANDSGFGYIYMGPEMRSQDIPNMYRSPHKLMKVNIPVRT
jgi:hypothetical protein